MGLPVYRTQPHRGLGYGVGASGVWPSDRTTLTTKLDGAHGAVGPYTANFVILEGTLGAYGAAQSIDGRTFSTGSKLAVASGMGFGIWQGVGIGRLSTDDDYKRSGAMLLGYGLGGISALTIATLKPPTKAEVGAVATTGFWGGWLGGFGAYLFKKHGKHADDEDLLLASSDLTSVWSRASWLVARGRKDAGRRIGYISLVGALGMGIGTSIGAISSDYVAEERRWNGIILSEDISGPVPWTLRVLRKQQGRKISRQRVESVAYLRSDARSRRRHRFKVG